MLTLTIGHGVVTVPVTPALRELALAHVAETEQGEDQENLTRWFQEQETPDGYVLDAATSPEEAHMITVIARAITWAHGRCRECGREYPNTHDRGCSYDDRAGE
jgi:hypothetical protein